MNIFFSLQNKTPYKRKVTALFFLFSLVVQASATPVLVYAGGSGEGVDGHKIEVCHIPQGNPENMQTIEVDEHSVTLEAHLKHGDTVGPCVAPPPPENLPPIITLLGENPTQIFLGGTYVDSGASASDPEDGDITQHIVISGTVDTQTLGTYFVSYNVVDSQNLSAETKTRTVNVVSGGGGGGGGAGGTPSQCADGSDNDADGLVDFSSDPGCTSADDNDEFDGVPTLTLLGASVINVFQGVPFTDPGATASDLEDGDLTADIVRTGTVDTQTIGAYTLTYNVSDEDGHAATQVVRTVNVVSGGGGGGGTPEPPAGGGAGQGGGGSTPPQCADGSDNDADGRADYPNDGGCENSQDNDESGGGPTQTETPSGGGGGGGGIPVPPASGGTGSPAQVSSGNLGGQGGGIVAGASTTNVTAQGEVLGETACVYLRDYLRLGMENDPAEVTKLQTFLRDFEGFTDLPVTGYFGAQTDKAVRMFQDRYRDDVLVPWDLPENTGYVYYTTRKKINEIYCQSAFPLDEDQLSEIAAFRELISGLNVADKNGAFSSSVDADDVMKDEAGDVVLGDTQAAVGVARSEPRSATLADILKNVPAPWMDSDDISPWREEGAGGVIVGASDKRGLAAAIKSISSRIELSRLMASSATMFIFLVFLLSGIFIRRHLIMRRETQAMSSFFPPANS